MNMPPHGDHPTSPLVSYGAPSKSLPASPASSSYTSAYEADDDEVIKSEMDIYRERGANRRALEKFDAIIRGDIDRPRKGSLDLPSITARKAAIMHHEQRQKERKEFKAKMKGDEEKFARPRPLLVPRKPLEEMAETTRRPRSKTEDDVRDPETVRGMLCKLHLDMEMEAKTKALDLLREGYLF
jgi:hypothetical protein